MRVERVAPATGGGGAPSASPPEAWDVEAGIVPPGAAGGIGRGTAQEPALERSTSSADSVAEKFKLSAMGGMGSANLSHSLSRFSQDAGKSPASPSQSAGGGGGDSGGAGTPRNKVQEPKGFEREQGDFELVGGNFGATIHPWNYGILHVRILVFTVCTIFILGIVGLVFASIMLEDLRHSTGSLTQRLTPVGLFINERELCLTSQASVSSDGDVLQPDYMLSEKAAPSIGDVVLINSIRFDALPPTVDVVVYNFQGWPEGQLPGGRKAWMWARQPFMLAVDHNFWQVVTLALMPIEVQEVLVTPYMGTGTNETQGIGCRDLVQNDQIRFRQAQSGVNDRAVETAGVYGAYEGDKSWSRPKFPVQLHIYPDRDIEIFPLLWYEIRPVVVAMLVLIAFSVLSCYAAVPRTIDNWQKAHQRHHANMRVRMTQLLNFGSIKLSSGDLLAYVPQRKLPQLPHYAILKTEKVQTSKEKNIGIIAEKRYIVPLKELRMLGQGYGPAYCQRLEAQGLIPRVQGRRAQREHRRKVAGLRQVHNRWQEFIVQNSRYEVATLHGLGRSHEGIPNFVELEDALGGNYFLLRGMSQLAKEVALAVSEPDEDLIRATIVIQKAWRAKMQVLRIAGSGKAVDMASQQIADIRRKRLERFMKREMIHGGRATEIWTWYNCSPFQLIFHNMEYLTSGVVSLFGGNLLPKSAKHRDLRVKSFLQDTLPKIKKDARNSIEKNHVLVSECMELVRDGIKVKRLPDPNSWMSKSFNSFRGFSRSFVKRQAPSFRNKIKKKKQTFFQYCVMRIIRMLKALMLAIINIRLTIQMSIVRWYLAEKILEHYPGLRNNYMTLVGLLAFFTVKMKGCKSQQRQEDLVVRMLMMSHILESVMDFLYDEELGSAEDQALVVRQISQTIAKMYKEEAAEKKFQTAEESDSSDDEKDTAQELARMKAAGASSLPAAQGAASALPEEKRKEIEQVGKELGKAAAGEALKMVGGLPMVGDLMGQVDTAREMVDTANQEYEGQMQKASELAAEDHEGQIQQQLPGGQFSGGILGALPPSLGPGLMQTEAGQERESAPGQESSPEKTAGEPAQPEGEGAAEGEEGTQKQSEEGEKGERGGGKDDRDGENESDSEDEDAKDPAAEMGAEPGGNANGDDEDVGMDDEEATGDGDEDNDDDGDASFMEEGATMGIGRRNLTKILTNWHITQTMSTVFSSVIVLLLTIPLTTTSYLLTFVISTKLLAAVPCFVAFILVVLLWVDFVRACTEPVFRDKLLLLHRATKSAAKAQEERVTKLLEEKSRVFERNKANNSVKQAMDRVTVEGMSVHDVKLLVKGFNAFVTARKVTLMRDERQVGKIREGYLYRWGFNAFKKWKEMKTQKEKSLSNNNFFLSRLLLRRYMLQWKRYSEHKKRAHISAQRNSPGAKARMLTLYLTGASFAYFVLFMSCAFMWLVVSSLTNVGEGGILAAAFLSGGIIVGKMYIKNKKKKKKANTDIRKSVEEKLKKANDDKFSLVQGSKKEKRKAVAALVPSKWVDMQMKRIRMQFTKAVNAITQHNGVLMTDEDLRYIYDDSLMGDLRVHLQGFHAAISAKRLKNILVKIRKTIMKHSHIPLNDEAWDSGSWPEMLGPTFKGKLTVESIVKDVERAAHAAQKKLMNLQARENMMRFFQTDEKKEEIISKAQMDYMQKSRNKDPFAIFVRIACIGVGVTFIVTSFQAFSPPGTLGNVVQAMMSIFLAMYLIGSAGGAGMGGAEAAAVDGSADAGMEGDMGDDGGGEGGDEGGDEEGEEEEEEEDEEGGGGKKGKGGKGGDSAKPLVVSLHTKVDQLMNAVVAVSKASQFPLEDLGFDDELLGVIEERLTTSSKADDVLGKKKEKKSDQGPSKKDSGLRQRATAAKSSDGSKAPQRLSAAGTVGDRTSSSTRKEPATAAVGPGDGSPAGEDAAPFSLAMLIAAKRKARLSKGKTD